MAVKEEKKQGVIAVHQSEFQKFGCPHCGGIYGYSNLSGGGAAVWNCSEPDCGKVSVVVSDELTESPIGIDGHNPKVQPHPRRGKPVDHKKLEREHDQYNEDEQLQEFNKWLALGFGGLFTIKKVGSHTSKSQKLPIIAANSQNSNVRVTWLGYNYHNYFTGIELIKPVNAILLSPVKSFFGGYALSGHVNTEIAPELENFDKDYHNRKMIDRFGVDSGDGYGSALFIRYLQEVSRIDIHRFLDVCFNDTSYGKVDSVDSNAIDNDDMAAVIGLQRKGRDQAYEFLVELANDSLFKMVEIDWYDSDIGNSSVQVKLKKGNFLPAIPISGRDLYVDAQDTALAKHLSKEIQVRKPGSYGDPHILRRVPVSILGRQEVKRDLGQKFDSNSYPVHYCYSAVKSTTREFTFNFTNILDAAMFAFFLTKVLDPVIKMMPNVSTSID